MKRKPDHPRMAARRHNARPDPRELAPDVLRWRCKPDDLGVKSLEEVNPLREIIGQDRAVRALRLGLEMKHQGYNIFVTGHQGTGRTTTIRRLLQDFEHKPASLTDKCYVYNFHDPDSPSMITLPAGQGTAFKKDMGTFLHEMLKGIPAVFESRR